MKIPVGPNGQMTLSASQFRKYGTGGFLLEFNEEAKGCPRVYKAKYVDKSIPKEDPREKPYELWYGSMFHRIMQLMDEGSNPDEALEEAFEPWMEQRAWTEARGDLDAYLERGASPSDRYATLATELELTGLLYVDEEFGEVWYRGFLDWIGLDPDLPGVIHSVDYKTNRSPARLEDLIGDVQFRGYDWLLRQNAEQFVQGVPARVVTHMDAVKFRDYEIVYSNADIDDWHSWAVAMARKILRDNEGLPVLNASCSYCPIRDTCPAFLDLPAAALELASTGAALTDPVRKLEWRNKANAMRLQLQKSVAAIDEEFKKAAMEAGTLAVGSSMFVRESDYGNEIDLREVHRMLGDEFYQIASVSKTALEKLAKSMEPSAGAQLLACVKRVVTGEKVTVKS